MEVHLPGVPHVFTDYQGLVGFLRNSPGYVQAQHPFLTRYWAGALHAAGYSIPQVKPVAPVAQAPKPVRQAVRPAPVAPVAKVTQAPKPPRPPVASPPGLLQPGNIDVNHRPLVPTPGMPGYHSTVRTLTVTDDRGRAYLIPSVIKVNGNWKVASGQEAIDHYRKTGQHLGVFKTEAQANAYGGKLHRDQMLPVSAGGPHLRPTVGLQAANTADWLNKIGPKAQPLSAAEKLHPPRPVQPGDAPFPLIDPLLLAAAKAAPGPRQQEGIVGVHSIASAVRGEPVSPWGLGLDIAGLLPIAPLRGLAAIRAGVTGIRAAETGARAIEGARAARVAYSTSTPLRTGARTVRALVVGEKTQQLPGARSAITRNLIENPADKFSAAHPDIPIAGARARVAKAAGMQTRQEAERAQALLAPHVRALPKEGSPEDIAHFWWAQLPASHRNVDGLRLIREKQAAELDRIASGKALEDLQKQQAAVKAKLSGAKGRQRFDLMQRAQDVKLRISDLPQLSKDVSLSLHELDKVIAKPPALNPKVINAVHALGSDRRKVLQEAGLLDPQRAQERQGLVSHFAGLEPTGEEAFIGHRLDRTRGAQASLLPASPGVGKAKIPQGLSRANKLILARQGRLRQSTRVAAEDWQAAQTYRSAVRARQDLAQLGKPFEGHVPADHMLVNPKGRPVPPQWKTDKVAQLVAHGADEAQIRKAADEIMHGSFLTGPEGADQMLKQAREQGVNWGELRVVPKQTVHRYYAQFQRPGRSGAVGNAYDTAIDATATSLIFARLGYIPKNVAQNLIMAAPHQGAFLLANVPRAAQVLRDPELRHIVGAEVGVSGPTQALGQEFVHKLRGAPGKITGAVSSVADTPLRISAFIHEAAAAGVIPRFSPTLSEADRAALHKLLTSPGERTLLNDIRSRSVESMADFSRLNPKQRKWMRRFLIIPGWLWAGSRYPAHFAATHPVRSAALAYAAAGEPGAPKQLQVNKPINEYFSKGLPSYASGIPTGGGKVFRTSSLSPVSTPWDIANALAGRQNQAAGDYANPLGAALYNIANRQVSSPKGPFKTNYRKSIEANLQRLAPGEKFVQDMVSPPKNPSTYPQDTSRLGRLEREVGVVPIKVNPATTKTQHGAQDALALVRKLGIGKTLPPDVAKSYTRAAQRDKAWADATSGKKPGTRDYYVARYKADIQLAQQWGYLTKAEAARENEWVAHAPIDDVRKAHADLSKPGGMYDQELSESRDTTAWLTAQDKYATDLDQAVKTGVLDAKQAQRERAWARNAGATEIDQNRTELERELLAPAR